MEVRALNLIPQPFMLEGIQASGSELNEFDQQFIDAYNGLIENTQDFLYNEYNLEDEYQNHEIRQRQQFLLKLLNEQVRENLASKAMSYWYANKCNGEEIKEKKSELKGLFEKFDVYASVAHFTAVELAVVSIAVSKLVSYYQAYKEKIQSAALKNQLENLSADLMQVQKCIYDCMKAHLEIFQCNLRLDEYGEDVPPNDILLAVKNQIQDLVGEPHIGQWPDIMIDKSLLLPIPALAFKSEDGQKTANYYFNLYVKDYEELVRNNTGIRGVLNGTGRLAAKGAHGVWSATTTVVTAPFWATGMLFNKATKILGRNDLSVIETSKLTGSNANPPEGEQDVNKSESQSREMELELIIKDAELYMISMRGLFEDHRKLVVHENKFKEVKEKVRYLLYGLSRETESMQNSCFSFFMKSSISLKKKKAKALQQLLGAEDVEELKLKASQLVIGVDGKDILRGRHSRTRTLIEEVKSYNLN